MASIPLWAVALVLVLVSPSAVRALTKILEERARRRTLDVLSRIPRGTNAQAASQARHGTADTGGASAADDAGKHP